MTKVSLRDDSYTLLFIPENNEETRAYRFSSRRFYFLLLSLLVTAIFVFIVFLHYQSMLSHVFSNYNLRKENRSLLKEVTQLSEHLVLLNQKVNVWNEVSGRFKQIQYNFSSQYLNSTLDIDLRKSIIDKSSLDQGDEALLIHFVSQPVKGGVLGSILTLEDFYQTLDIIYALQSKVISIESDLQSSYDFFSERNNVISSLPLISPTQGVFTSGFGVRSSLLDGRLRMHEGLDITGREGTPVVSTAQGKVIFSGVVRAYGRTVVIDHGNNVETWYAHLKNATVEDGQQVNRGEVIGELGSSGVSSGMHLHYEVRVNNVPVDPQDYIFDDWAVLMSF